MTGFGTVETAIDAMKRGAYDYILKPFKVEEVIHIVQRGLEKQRLAAENLRLQGGPVALQGERGHRRQPFARRGHRDGHRQQPARGPRRRRLDLARRRRGRLLRAQQQPRVAVAHWRIHRPLHARRRGGASRARWTHRRARRSGRRAVCRAAQSPRLQRGGGPDEDDPGKSPGRDARAPDRLDWRGVADLEPAFRRRPAQATQHSGVACRGGHRERAPLRGPSSDLPADHQGLGDAPSTRWTATPPGTRSASRSTPCALARWLGLGRRPNRDRAAVGADARHRQDRLRDEPQQARQAHPRRVRDLQEAPGVRPRDPRPDQVPRARSSRACTCTTSAGTAVAIRSASRATTSR